MSVRESGFKRIRAMKMIEGKALHGKTNVDLAKDFNVSVATVERTLSWAARADLFSTYEDKIVTELLPLAHSAISTALADGNAKIGVEILKGIGLLRNGGTPTSRVQAQHDDDLATYIAKKRDYAQLQESIIETTTTSELPQGSIQFLGQVDSSVATEAIESNGSTGVLPTAEDTDPTGGPDETFTYGEH